MRGTWGEAEDMAACFPFTHSQTLPWAESPAADPIRPASPNDGDGVAWRPALNLFRQLLFHAQRWLEAGDCADSKITTIKKTQIENKMTIRASANILPIVI